VERIKFTQGYFRKNTCPNVGKFSVRVTYGRGVVLLWWRSDALCTSGLVDGVMFFHNGPSILCQCAVQKLELLSDVNVFVKLSQMVSQGKCLILAKF